MKTVKITSLLSIIIYIGGALFLFFRQTDGAGATNSTANQIVSLVIWTFVFLIIWIGCSIAYFSARKQK